MNIEKNLEVDSRGNTLTLSQIKFFENSKIRDNDGNLLVCYHGTDANFDAFDYAHINQDNKLGLGFYFTKGENLQYNYEHELACYLNITNPIYERDNRLNDILQEEERLIDEGKTNNEILSDIIAKFGFDGIVGDDNGHKTIVAFNPSQIKLISNEHPTTLDNINEELLVEKNRQELINKSKNGREYSKKNQARGKNRWERRRYSQIANSVRDYNNIDMDAFFKGDILDFKINVKGETDNYIVSITFERILNNIQQEVKSNNNKLEFKCVLRALLRAFNGEDVYLGCSCPDFKFRFQHHATTGRYNAIAPELRPNRFSWTNSQDDMGSACKHVNLVLSNTDWMMKVASVINNYIKWCKENMSRNYADYIFPKVYGMPYDRAVQLSIFDDPEDNGLLPSDQETLNKIIDKSLKGKDEKGRWVKDNEFRFQKKDLENKPKYPEDNPNQLKLNFDKDEDDKELNIKVDEKEVNKRIKMPDEEEETNNG